MAKVEWRRTALDDLDRIIRYIEQSDPDAADRKGTELVDLGESLADFPHRGRPLADGTREMTNIPPYILSYIVEGETVGIIAIRHGRQRPAR